VQQHARPGQPLISPTGRFQRLYYLGTHVTAAGFSSERPDFSQLAALEPGTWLIHRSDAPLQREYTEHFEVRAHFEIPSKPWSRVLYVLQVPERARAE